MNNSIQDLENKINSLGECVHIGYFFGVEYFRFLSFEEGYVLAEPQRTTVFVGNASHQFSLGYRSEWRGIMGESEYAVAGLLHDAASTVMQDDRRAMLDSLYNE